MYTHLAVLFQINIEVNNELMLGRVEYKYLFSWGLTNLFCIFGTKSLNEQPIEDPYLLNAWVGDGVSR